ncbi:Periplasmic copper-binding domain containing protein [Salinisphaera shabanensis E1L3A]|uniref:Periplasmic copper-binding domain containing protein n=1 Tax=Salinisphaera shabanensis E1L3A TaxID=1033802 RepID=U2EGF5_9GAMM|nr:nitrous oxide reductase family maturation protein NosD [Salinisphaera shabanensis]ERJ17492.1 Periplasmic copper-binding domain containing protein [Salinisphaera shabanensis E1L3A]
MARGNHQSSPAGRALGLALLLWAAVHTLPGIAQSRPTLAERIGAASEGDVIHLNAGIYHGPVTIDKRIVLQGEEGAIVEGDGESSVITVSAAGAEVRGLTITGSGLSLQAMDSGVVLHESARGAVVANNRIENNLIGVHIEGAPDSLVKNNTILGRRDLRVNERGNGVYLWSAPGARVIGNAFRYGRDGIFTTTSTDNVFADNRFRDLRYAVHYMYTEDSTVRDNVSVGNHIGYAIMYSSRIEIRRNISRGDRDHGLMLNFVNYSTVEDNAVVDGGKKCVFIYNANANEFRGNRFEGCDLGVHFTAGSEQNTLVGNAFIGNRTQVKYVGTRNLRWTEDERGNYWSDHAAFDLDGNGIADQAYRPNGLVDQIIWRMPQAKLLLSSPAVQLLRWAQAAFPAIRPGGVVDTAPLMRAPQLPACVNRELNR